MDSRCVLFTFFCSCAHDLLLDFCLLCGGGIYSFYFHFCCQKSSWIFPSKLNFLNLDGISLSFICVVYYIYHDKIFSMKFIYYEYFEFQPFFIYENRLKTIFMLFKKPSFSILNSNFNEIHNSGLTPFHSKFSLKIESGISKPSFVFSEI